MGKEKLIYKINGKEYLLFEFPVTSHSTLKGIIKEAEKFGGFMQGIKDIKTRIFGGHAIVRLLVPTNKAIQFAKFGDKK